MIDDDYPSSSSTLCADVDDDDMSLLQEGKIRVLTLMYVFFFSFLVIISLIRPVHDNSVRYKGRYKRYIHS